MKPRYWIAFVVAAIVLAFFLLVSGVIQIMTAVSWTSRGLSKSASVLGFLATVAFCAFWLIAAIVLASALVAKSQGRGEKKLLSIALVLLGAVFALMQLISGLASMIMGISDNVSTGLIKATSVLHSLSGIAGGAFWVMLAFVLVMLLTTNAAARRVN